jgi:hypothetical protein
MKCLKSILPVSLLSVSELAGAHSGHGGQISHTHEFLNAVSGLTPDLLLVCAIATPVLLLTCIVPLWREHRGVEKEHVA